jgi:peroxiredoxin
MTCGPEGGTMGGAMATLDVGMKAPDFMLESTIGDKVTLSNILKEKNAVLLFYVLAFSSV